MKSASRFLMYCAHLAGWLAFCLASGATIGAEKDEGGTTVSYHRHVTALLGKLGCNGGSCHGAVKGRNGFRLSMFSADPVGDHARLVREFEGRRLDLFAPDDSLVLLKATGRVPHRGGVRTQVGSREYRALRDWIAAGAPADDESASRLVKLEVTPREHVAKAGEQFSLRAVARFVDGREEDVTWLCSFESLDRAVAAVDSDGRVTAMMTGDAGLVVRYRAQPAIARVIVPRAAESTNNKSIEVAQKEAGQRAAAANFIDSHVLAKLDRLNLPATSVCDDATFFRRLHLDVTGRLPEADAVREFLADQHPDKRQ
ncbi:MAG TPA: DUF1549 domain-containing protein, partial [Pirellulaceae bacterium]|nr:DUF1549 domain-containing protein [Pirellulaceae bacterium]